MNDILIVCGTRPEIIKFASLMHALRARPGVNPVWLHTGQHAEMARHTQSEFSLGCREQLEAVLQQRRWALVIAQGDTESAFLGALAGFYHRVPVAPVEAGLRTHDLASPFPEEDLRQMIGRIARFHFPPTAGARDALLADGIPADRIVITGNTVIDAQHWIRSRHAIARRHPDAELRFPVHLNPVIQKPVQDILGGLQEESPTFGVPVLVLRSETERPEAITAGCARSLGTDRERRTGGGGIVDERSGLPTNARCRKSLRRRRSLPSHHRGPLPRWRVRLNNAPAAFKNRRIPCGG